MDRLPAPTPDAAPPQRRRVTPETLNVAPALLGQPLASPGRRLLAMLVDLGLIGMLSSLGNLWLLLGLGAGGLAIERQRQGRGTPRRQATWWTAAVLLVAFGLWQAWQTGPRASRHTAVDDETLPAAVSAAASAASSVAAGGDADAATRELAMNALAARNEALEAEVARLRASPVTDWRRRAEGWLDELGLGYGWALLYFSLLTAWGRGQTPGKRLLRLRVVELTGRPMTALLALKRFGGYAAAMATGVGLLQLLWDTNRQGLQDKAAHTVVLDLR